MPQDCNIVIGKKKVVTKVFALSDKTQGSVFIPTPHPFYFFFCCFKHFQAFAAGSAGASTSLHAQSYTLCKPGQITDTHTSAAPYLEVLLLLFYFWCLLGFCFLLRLLRLCLFVRICISRFCARRCRGKNDR